MAAVVDAAKSLGKSMGPMSLFAWGHCTSACACCMKACEIDSDVVKIEIPDLQKLELKFNHGLADQMVF
jgi:hypothetical protein